MDMLWVTRGEERTRSILRCRGCGSGEFTTNIWAVPAVLVCARCGAPRASDANNTTRYTGGTVV